MIGNAAGLLLLILRLTGVWPLHFTIDVGLLTAFSTLIFVVVSLRTPAPDPETIARTTWSPALLRDPEVVLPDFDGSAAKARAEGIVVADATPDARKVTAYALGLGALMIAVLLAFW